MYTKKTHSVGSFFSIITVTLNPGENDLLKTVDSVMAQDFPDWELIIKDGGSTDGSLECLPVDKRIRIVHEKDSGIFDAMNQAVKYARGKFINFLNAGDFFYDYKALSAVAETHSRSPEADFLYGNVHKPYSRSGYELYPSKLSRFYLFKHMICHQAWFVRNHIYEKVGRYETNYKTGADYRYLLKMLYRYGVPYQRISRVVVAYKGSGISQINQNKKVAKEWVNELRLDLFGVHQCLIFSILWEIRDILKKTFYDGLLFVIWKVAQKWRVNIMQYKK